MTLKCPIKVTKEFRLEYWTLSGQAPIYGRRDQGHPEFDRKHSEPEIHAIWSYKERMQNEMKA